MDRRRFLQLAFTTVLILFLLILVFRFRPRVETPEPLTPGKGVHTAEGTLSAKGFRYSQEAEGKAEYVVTADSVTESSGGIKLLDHPLVLFPGQGKATGKKGSFHAEDRTFRIWEDARLDLDDGWTAVSTGFRLTPEGEVVTEGPVAFHREEISGKAQLLRYRRDSQTAHLEGDVTVVQGTQTLACRILNLNLARHAGDMRGPVVLTSEQGTVTSPRGTLLLDDQNHIKEVDLAGPCEGTGPELSFTSENLAAHSTAGGALQSVELKGDVVVHDSRPPASTLKTAALTLEPKTGGLWAWTSPQVLTILQAGSTAAAASGSGTFGGTAPSAADLAGPVQGSQAQGTFRADRAELAGGDWTLLGNAVVDRTSERVSAQRIFWKADGSSEAEGGVQGLRRPPQGAELRFACAKLQAGPGGYPARLEGGAQVIRGEMTLSAPEIFVADARTAAAQDGARAVFEDDTGQHSVVTGSTVTFDGAAHTATAQGEARGESGPSWVTAESLVAHLDANDRPATYEAKGDAKFSDPTYAGQADFLTYDLSTQQGTATGVDRDAVVVQHKPARRLAGPVIDFAPGKAEVRTGGQPMRRGRLEGTQPEAMEKGKTHGR